MACKRPGRTVPPFLLVESWERRYLSSTGSD